jgi:hypothetical protein
MLTRKARLFSVTRLPEKGSVPQKTRPWPRDKRSARVSYRAAKQYYRVFHYEIAGQTGEHAAYMMHNIEFLQHAAWHAFHYHEFL